MSTATDTPDERLAAYRRLFERALLRRERRDDGVVFAFRADAAEAVEDLARREAACCPFLDYRVETVGGEVDLDHHGATRMRARSSTPSTTSPTMPARASTACSAGSASPKPVAGDSSGGNDGAQRELRRS